MITYEQILTAWEAYHASQSGADRDALWMLTQECMEALIKTSLRGQRVIDDDLHDMIADATCSVMERFQAAYYADLAWIGSRISLQARSAVGVYQRMGKYLARHNDDADLSYLSMAVDILQKPCQV